MYIYIYYIYKQLKHGGVSTCGLPCQPHGHIKIGQRVVAQFKSGPIHPETVWEENSVHKCHLVSDKATIQWRMLSVILQSEWFTAKQACGTHTKRTVMYDAWEGEVSLASHSKPLTKKRNCWYTRRGGWPNEAQWIQSFTLSHPLLWRKKHQITIKELHSVQNFRHLVSLRTLFIELIDCHLPTYEHWFQ